LYCITSDEKDLFVCTDPGDYFYIDSPITGRLFNRRRLVLSDDSWSLGYMTITVQVCCTRTSVICDFSQSVSYHHHRRVLQ